MRSAKYFARPGHSTLTKVSRVPASSANRPALRLDSAGMSGPAAIRTTAVGCLGFVMRQRLGRSKKRCKCPEMTSGPEPDRPPAGDDYGEGTYLEGPW